MARYKQMTEDELKALSLEKNKQTGCYKKTAIKAQQELYNRHHWETHDDLYSVIDDYADRSIEDIQYNG